MNFLDLEISPLGLGCWPIGGEMYNADGQSVGYPGANDHDSMKAIHAALDNGITLFDTAAAYGAGHSERLLAKALKNRSEAIIVTKIGIAINEATKTLTSDDTSPESVMPAIDGCLKRLNRETIDLLLLHPNEVLIDEASLVFDEMEKARQLGKIKAFGWSTDHIANVSAIAERTGFQAVEFAMNVFMNAPNMQTLVQENNLQALIRSPLAMGLLSGKYNSDSRIAANDVRASNPGWARYYVDGKPNSEYINRLQAVRELLQTNGRTLVQGSLAWLWAQSPNNIPIPGARNVEQVLGLANALEKGPLPTAIAHEITTLIGVDLDSRGDASR